jgi:hypothetical protein
MVALNWIVSYVFSCQLLFDHVGYVNGSLNNVMGSVHPDVVGRVISSPEEEFRFDVTLNELEEGTDSDFGEVTEVAAPLLRFPVVFGWVTVLWTTAHAESANNVGTLSVQMIQVRVGEMHSLDSRPSLALNRLIELIQIVIVLDRSWFRLYHEVDLILRMNFLESFNCAGIQYNFALIVRLEDGL